MAVYAGSFASGFINAFLQARRLRMQREYYAAMQQYYMSIMRAANYDPNAVTIDANGRKIVGAYWDATTGRFDLPNNPGYGQGETATGVYEAGRAGYGAGGINYERANELVSDLTARGVDPAVAAYAIGSMMGETNGQLDPRGWNPHDPDTPSGGFGQWHKERLDGLFKYAGTNDINQIDFETQRKYWNSELDGKYKGVIAALKGVDPSRPEEGGRIWATQYEGAKEGPTLHMDRRLSFGRTLAEHGAYKPPAGETETATRAPGPVREATKPKGEEAPKVSPAGGPTGRDAEGRPVQTDDQGRAIDPKTGKPTAMAEPRVQVASTDPRAGFQELAALYPRREPPAPELPEPRLEEPPALPPHFQQGYPGVGQPPAALPPHDQVGYPGVGQPPAALPPHPQVGYPGVGQPPAPPPPPASTSSQGGGYPAPPEPPAPESKTPESDKPAPAAAPAHQAIPARATPGPYQERPAYQATAPGQRAVGVGQNPLLRDPYWKPNPPVASQLSTQAKVQQSAAEKRPAIGSAAPAVPPPRPTETQPAPSGAQYGYLGVGQPSAAPPAVVKTPVPERVDSGAQASGAPIRNPNAPADMRNMPPPPRDEGGDNIPEGGGAPQITPIITPQMIAEDPRVYESPAAAQAGGTGGSYQPIQLAAMPSSPRREDMGDEEEVTASAKGGPIMKFQYGGASSGGGYANVGSGGPLAQPWGWNQGQIPPSEQIWGPAGITNTQLNQYDPNVNYGEFSTALPPSGSWVTNPNAMVQGFQTYQLGGAFGSNPLSPMGGMYAIPNFANAQPPAGAPLYQEYNVPVGWMPPAKPLPWTNQQTPAPAPAPAAPAAPPVAPTITSTTPDNTLANTTTNTGLFTLPQTTPGTPWFQGFDFSTPGGTNYNLSGSNYSIDPYGTITSGQAKGGPVGFADGGDVSASALGMPPALSGGQQQIPPYYFNPATYSPAGAPVGKGPTVTNVSSIIPGGAVPTYADGGSVESAGEDDTAEMDQAGYAANYADLPSPAASEEMGRMPSTVMPMHAPSLGGGGMRGPTMRPRAPHPGMGGRGHVPTEKESLGAATAPYVGADQPGWRNPDAPSYSHEKPGNLAPWQAQIVDGDGNPSYGFTSAIAGGIRWMAQTLGLEGPQGAVAGDPRTQTLRQMQATGGFSASPEEISSVTADSDPQSLLDNGMRNMAGLENLYKWYNMQGRVNEADQASAAMINGMIDMASAHGDAAWQKWAAGDPEGALRDLEAAKDLIPDGSRIRYIWRGDGKIDLRQTNLANKVLWEQVVGPEAIAAAIKGVQDKSWAWGMVERAAQRYDPGLAAKAKERQIRSGQRELAELESRRDQAETAGQPPAGPQATQAQAPPAPVPAPPALPPRPRPQPIEAPPETQAYPLSPINEPAPAQTSAELGAPPAGEQSGSAQGHAPPPTSDQALSARMLAAAPAIPAGAGARPENLAAAGARPVEEQFKIPGQDEEAAPPSDVDQALAEDQATQQRAAAGYSRIGDEAYRRYPDLPPPRLLNPADVTGGAEELSALRAENANTMADYRARQAQVKAQRDKFILDERSRVGADVGYERDIRGKAFQAAKTQETERYRTQAAKDAATTAQNRKVQDEIRRLREPVYRKELEYDPQGTREDPRTVADKYLARNFAPSEAGTGREYSDPESSSAFQQAFTPQNIQNMRLMLNTVSAYSKDETVDTVADALTGVVAGRYQPTPMAGYMVGDRPIIKLEVYRPNTRTRTTLFMPKEDYDNLGSMIRNNAELLTSRTPVSQRPVAMPPGGTGRIAAIPPQATIPPRWTPSMGPGGGPIGSGVRPPG